VREDDPASRALSGHVGLLVGQVAAVTQAHPARRHGPAPGRLAHPRRRQLQCGAAEPLPHTFWSRKSTQNLACAVSEEVSHSDQRRIGWAGVQFISGGEAQPQGEGGDRGESCAVAKIAG
jgi:hypothetical protein